MFCISLFRCTQVDSKGFKALYPKFKEYMRLSFSSTCLASRDHYYNWKEYYWSYVVAYLVNGQNMMMTGTLRYPIWSLFLLLLFSSFFQTYFSFSLSMLGNMSFDICIFCASLKKIFGIIFPLHGCKIMFLWFLWFFFFFFILLLDFYRLKLIKCAIDQEHMHNLGTTFEVGL